MGRATVGISSNFNGRSVSILRTLRINLENQQQQQEVIEVHSLLMMERGKGEKQLQHLHQISKRRTTSGIKLASHDRLKNLEVQKMKYG